MRRWITFVGGVLMIGALMVGHASAQVATATVSGTVRDATGGVLPGASVTVLNIETGATRSAVSDHAGAYFEPNLALGEYEVRAELAGFRTEIRKGITLTVGRHAVIEFKLGVGDVTEEVTVTAEAPLVDTKSASVGGLVDQHEINQLPLNGRSFGELTRLIPGVVAGRGAVDFQGGFTENISMRGSRGEANKILLDGTDIQGIDNKLPGGVGGLTLGVESVREFRVEVGTYSAEFGRALGGIINVSTRSGTNAFHGNVFEFHRNHALDSKNYFDEEKPDFTRHQFGFALGGPIVHDKTHFFANIEALRERLGFTSIAKTPTAAARQGLLPDGRGGVTRITVNPTVVPYLAAWPLPNGRDYGDGTGELVQNAKMPTDQQFFAGRIDHRFSDSDSIFVRYTYDHSERLTPFDYSFLHQPQRSRNQFVTVEESKILSPRLFNTFRFGFARNYKSLDPAESDVEVPDSLGIIPGYRFWDAEWLVAGLSDMGVPDSPRVWATNKFQFSEQAVWRVGGHTLKFGTEVIRFQQNIAQNSNNGGEFQFGSLRNLLLGTPSRFRARMPGSDQTRLVRNTYVGSYVQDDITLSPRFTLNIGLRHELHTGPNEVDGKCSNVDDTLAQNARVGCPLFPTFAKNFGPRVGFAWDVAGNGRTSIRGGTGIYFSEMSASSYYTSMTNQPPLTLIADVRNPVFPNAYATIIERGSPRLRANPNSYTAVPSTMQFSLTMQRELAKNTVASVGYAGSLGRNWIRRGQENVAQWQVLPDGRKYFPANGRQISPYWAEIRRVVTDVNTSYNGLLVEVKRRFSARFSAQGSYTLSKAIDTAPFTTAGDVLDFYDRSKDMGLSDNDVRHNISSGFVVELPDLGGSPVANALVGGWQVGGILHLSSGQPFSALVGYNISRDLRGNNDAERPNLAPGANSNPVLGGADRYFDPMAFVLQEPGFYGDVPRNTIIGPGYSTLDFSLTKNAKLGGSRVLQLRLEFFNVLNRVNFGLPNAVVFTSAGRDGSAGRITTTRGTARQIQLGAKLSF